MVRSAVSRAVGYARAANRNARFLDRRAEQYAASDMRRFAPVIRGMARREREHRDHMMLSARRLARSGAVFRWLYGGLAAAQVAVLAWIVARAA